MIIIILEIIDNCYFLLQENYFLIRDVLVMSTVCFITVRAEFNNRFSMNIKDFLKPCSCYYCKKLNTKCYVGQQHNLNILIKIFKKYFNI